jgi:hypothetical protein
VPPQDAPWQTFEMEARGTIPRSDKVANFETRETKRKREAELNELAQRKRAQEKRPQTGGLRYKQILGYSPALCQMLDTVKRPTWFPPPVQIWSESCKVASKHLGLLSNIDATQLTGTFFPPTSIFFNVSDRSKLTSMVVRLVQLWPYLHGRIILARTDDAVRRLGTDDWRRVLAGYHFAFDVGRPKENKPDFDKPEELYAYGSELFFGRALTDKVQKGGVSCLKLGTMGCGHLATKDDVNSDEVIQAILARLSEEITKLQLAACAPKSWQDLKPAKDKYGEHRTPSFESKEDTDGRPVLQLINRLFRPMLDDDDDTPFKDLLPFVQKSRFWQAENRKQREPWLADLAKFFVSYVEGVDDLFAAQPDGKWWGLPWRRLKTIKPEQLKKPQWALLEKMLLEAWHVSCMKNGVPPQQLLPRLADRSGAFFPNCAKCRIATKIADGFDPHDPLALSDEE